MHPFSDSDTSDSEDGIRFKTQSTRKKEKSVKEERRHSPDHRQESRRRRSHSRSTYRHRSRSRERDRHRHKKHRRDRDNHERQSSSRTTESSRSVKSYKQVPESSNDRVKHISLEGSRQKDGGSCEDRRNVESEEGERVKEDSSAFGPSLPPCFSKNDLSGASGDKIPRKILIKHEPEQEILSEKGLGQSIPTKLNNDLASQAILNNDDDLLTKLKQDENIGPVLPVTLNNDDISTKELDSAVSVAIQKSVDVIADVSHSNKDQIGPALPIHLVKSNDIIGPALPPKLINPDKARELQSTNSNSCNDPTVPYKVDEHTENAGSLNSTDCIGPDLPSNLVLNKTPMSTEESEINIGPALPAHLLKGPAIPSNVIKQSNIERKLSTNDNNTSIESDILLNLDNDSISLGPALPPHLTNSSNEEASFGPSLPPSFSKTEEPKYIGPALPAHLREKLKNNEEISEFVDEAESDDYGPLPAGASPRTDAHVALEERALQMKLDKLKPTQDGKPMREEWMTELPSAAARIGLGPRQFRAKEGPDMSDRSSWTDTPQDKEKKKEKSVDLKEEAELQETMCRDKEQESIIKNHKKKKKRDKSLLEQHQEKIKKKKEEESSSGNVRRPFSRDIDLKVNHFDEAQKKAIFKKAQLLDDRFSKGQSKYL